MSQHPSPLDRKLRLPGWFGGLGLLVLLVAAFLRLFRLDTYLLNVREAAWAYDAFSMYHGRPLPLGHGLPESAPFMLVWNAVSYFLFGVTDATARVGSALMGIGLVALVFLLRPHLSRPQVLSIAGILAISPTMVFASRTIEPGIAAAFFAVLVLVTLVRIGTAAEHKQGWAMVLGFATGGLYATGTHGVTTLLALGLGIAVVSASNAGGRVSADTVGVAIRQLGRDRRLIVWTLSTLLITLLFFFTRAFSSLSSIAGLGTTITDWTSMLTSGAGTVPALFSFWSLMLYETIAVGIAILTAVFSRTTAMRRDKAGPGIAPLLYVIWFAVALLINTLSTTRDTGSAILVALPVLLLAGTGLGRFIEISVQKASPRIVTGVLVSALLVVYSLNATIGLNFTRGETGQEPLAHDTPTAETRSFLDQVMRLSRDLSVNRATPMDPTGHYGLTIQVSPEYEWPFTWYFRDFPQFSVRPVGAITAETDVAIAANAEVMESVGLTPASLVWNQKPGDPLTMMRGGEILRVGLNPANWGEAWNYMIHRETDRHENPRTLTYGYSVRVMNKLTTQTGPYNLFDSSSPGPGGGLGQLHSPAGIDVGEDGTIYVLNAGNARVDRFDENGTFLGIWSGQVDAPLQLSWNGFQGGTGLHVGPDGLIYIADTWNHAVVVVNPNGTVVRVLGNRGTQTDITDEGDPADQLGLFFGPRDIAVNGERIYVTDTGNERVQVFAMDGTFISAFGGFGSDDGQFIEPTGIALSPDGTVWVADSGNARIQVFDADGTWQESHPMPLWENQFGVERLNMLAFDAEGVLYFTTPREGVWAWYNGTLVQVALEAESRDILPGGIAIDQDGQLLVTLTNAAEVLRVDTVPLTEFGPVEATPQASPMATPEP